MQNLHSNVKYITTTKIKSRHTDIEISLSCLIVKGISEAMPSVPALKEQYTKCIQSYLKESHMTPISKNEPINYGY